MSLLTGRLQNINFRVVGVLVAVFMLGIFGPRWIFVTIFGAFLVVSTVDEIWHRGGERGQRKYMRGPLWALVGGYGWFAMMLADIAPASFRNSLTLAFIVLNQVALIWAVVRIFRRQFP